MKIWVNTEDKLRSDCVLFTEGLPEDAFKFRLWKLDLWQLFRNTVFGTAKICESQVWAPREL